MSRIINQLNSLKGIQDQRTQAAMGPSASLHSTVLRKHSRSPIEGERDAFVRILYLGLIVVCLLSLVLNAIAFQEIQKSQQSSSGITGVLKDQQTLLTELKETINDNQVNFVQSISLLNEKLKGLKNEISSQQADIKKLSNNNDDFTKKIDDLNWSKQNLTNKYVELNSKVSRLANGSQQ